MDLIRSWRQYYIILLVNLRRFRKKFRIRFQDVEVELYDLNKVAGPYFHYFNLILVIAAVASLIAAEGFGLKQPYKTWNAYLEFGIVVGFLAVYFGRLILTSKRLQLIRSRLLESFISFMLLFLSLLILLDLEELVDVLEILIGVDSLLPVLVSVTKLYLIIIVVIKFIQAAPILLNLKTKPTQLIAGSFLGVILVGALLLMTPSATVEQGGLSFTDALFTSTSAVCVTGLIVVDTATVLSLFGQIVVLVLIQLGGLGILTIATLFALYLSSGLGVGQMALLKGSVGETRTSETFRTIKRIVAITFSIEALGTIAYFVSWESYIDDSWTRFFFALFHAVSAFCNAGFSLFTNSLADKPNMLNVGVNITTICLIIIGGLGFTTIWELMRGNPNRKLRHWKLSIHTKLVLYSTFFLITAGTIGFLFLEWSGVLTGLDFSDKMMVSVFQSVTTRTAGFNSVDIRGLDISTTIIFLSLMFIGASPASTAGGIKTTTVSVLILSVWSTITGKREVEFSGRTIRTETVFTALSVLVLATVSLFIFTLILTITEDHLFVDLLFEEISAFATVGLSRGITPSMSTIGKFVLIVSMFVGRVGIVTLALAFARSRSTTKYKYPTESVIVA